MALRFQHFEVSLREDGSPEELGRGAMGITYKAFDTNLRCHVALKVINASYLQSEIARQRFLREARAAAALRHPNVATVFHLGEEEGNCFYAMEFVDGETVESWMKRSGAIPAATALEIALQVTRALGAAHKQGLIHRDIKPSNLMIVREDDSEFTVKVIDFGLAKNSTEGANEDAATVTLGGFLGTPHFASPEQLEERELDVRSDIYSLGVTLYYMLAGRTPFSGSIAQVMSQHLHRDPPLESLGPQPAAICRILTRMLAKDPNARPQTPAELRQELENALASLRSGPPAPPAPVDSGFETVTEPPGQPPRENPAPLRPRKSLALPAIVLVAILAMAATGLYILRPFRPSSTELAAATPVPSPTPETSPEVAPDAIPAISPPTEPTPDPTAQRLAAIQAAAADDPVGALRDLLAWQASSPELTPALNEMLAGLAGRAGSLSPGVRAALIPHVTAAAEADHVAAQKFLAAELRGTDPVAALKWYSVAGDNGDTASMIEAGQMLAGGLGVPSPDPSLAVPWFRKAAESGDPMGMFLLGECHLHGLGIPTDKRAAVEWFEKSAAAGNALAMNSLGDLSKKGVPGVLPANPARAFEWFSQASELGLHDARGNLGVLYMTGFPGQAPDPARAVELFREGVEADNPACMYFYAVSLERGLGGLPADPDSARAWYTKAAELGNTPAREWCRKNNVPFQAGSIR